MFKIQYYSKNDYNMIKEWWLSHKEIPPQEDMLPSGSTFIIRKDDTPLACVTVFLTNSKLAWVDNLVGNPEYKNEDRKLAISKLQEFIENFVSLKGYTRLFCMSIKDKTTNRYMELGYKPTCSSITGLVKEI